jgi:flagellar biosynthesis/type III secretory pathway protein FliH
MSRRFVPEQFDSPTPVDLSAAGGGPASDDAMEEARLAGFDQGFKAGWEDCEAAQKGAAQDARADVLRHLQEMSFGYHEAHGHFLAALRPVFEALTERFLPDIARQTLGPRVLEALMPLAQARLDCPVRLNVHPDSRLMLEEFLAGAVCPPFETVEDPALAPGVVILAAGEAEVLVDADSVVEALREIVAQHFEPRQEQRRHG